MSTGSDIRRLVRTTPYRYQIRGVRFMEQHGGRVLLGDDMGLGKTYQVICWMALHPEDRPAVIVCPSTLKWTWQRELRKHGGIKSKVLNGRKATRLPRSSVLIINYDILQHWLPLLLPAKPKLLVIDECQYVRTQKAIRTKACKQLSHHTPHIFALSGTPILNRPVEFFPVLQMLRPAEFSSFWKYAFAYCKPKRGFRGCGWDFRGASNTDELHTRLKTVMIRRMKHEVLTQLPRKTRTVILVDIDNMNEYLEAKEDFLEWLKGKQGKKAAEKASGALALVRLGALKLLAAEGKLAAIRAWVEDFLEASGQKLVLFGIHKPIMSTLKQWYPRAAYIVGEVKPAQRQAEVDRFQQDKNCRLFLGNIQAAGVGNTLTAASTVAFAEIGWTPGEHDQAEDRVLRIGQTADKVSAYYFVGRNTVEERLLELIDEKRTTIDAILNGAAVQDNIIGRLLSELERE